MLGLTEAEHAEDRPDASLLLITPVVCPVPDRSAGAPKLSGTKPILLREGSRARSIYGGSRTNETYFCNFELNLAYRELFERSGLAITGEGPGGEARIAELPSHPFFLGTLYQPQRASHPGQPHPLIHAFVRAAAGEG